MPIDDKKEITFFGRVKFCIEFALVKSIDFLISIMPERMAVAAGVLLGKTYHALSPYRRSVARKNLERAMPGKHTPEELDRLVREIFINIGLTTVESMWIRRRSDRKSIIARLPLEGAEKAEEALKAGKGCITFSPHLGNWELLGGSVAAHLGGLNALARPTNNPYVANYISKIRQDMNITLLSTREGVRPMISVLREGKALGILIDQHVNKSGVPAIFWGLPAATTAVVASLGLRMGVPVFLCYTLRDGRSFRHHGYVKGPIELIDTGDKEADVLKNTQMFNDMIESAIKVKPEQWLWTHRRWKLADSLARAEQKELITNE